MDLSKPSGVPSLPEKEQVTGNSKRLRSLLYRQMTAANIKVFWIRKSGKENTPNLVMV